MNDALELSRIMEELKINSNEEYEVAKERFKRLLWKS